MSTLREQALTHSSWTHEKGGTSYDRLEFFGDAILQFLVSELLYAEVAGTEGELTRMRSDLVRKSTLARLARAEGLSPRMGSNQAPSEKVLSDVFEAHLAAVYLEEGMEAARALVRRCLLPLLAEVGQKDPRTRLQEYCQQTFRGAVPEYRELGQQGPEHEPTHACAVFIEGQERGRGQGRNKVEARLRAAAQALRALAIEPASAGGGTTG